MKPFISHPFRLISCILTLLAFVWITLVPAYISTNQIKASEIITPSADQKKSSENSQIPFSGNSEENSDLTSNVFDTEYVHDEENKVLFHDISPKQHTHKKTANLKACHLESVFPPPKSNNAGILNKILISDLYYFYNYCCKPESKYS